MATLVRKGRLFEQAAYTVTITAEGGTVDVRLIWIPRDLDPAHALVYERTLFDGQSLSVPALGGTPPLPNKVPSSDDYRRLELRLGVSDGAHGVVEVVENPGTDKARRALRKQSFEGLVAWYLSVDV